MSDPDAPPAAAWLAQGSLDLRAAEILLAQAGPLPVVAFHIQQAIEKALKGFLIHTGWTLRRIHDLEVLAQEAAARDADLAPLLGPCQRITEYYIETRYPLGVHTPFHSESLTADLKLARALIDWVGEKLGLEDSADGRG